MSAGAPDRAPADRLADLRRERAARLARLRGARRTAPPRAPDAAEPALDGLPARRCARRSRTRRAGAAAAVPAAVLPFQRAGAAARRAKPKRRGVGGGPPPRARRSRPAARGGPGAGLGAASGPGSPGSPISRDARRRRWRTGSGRSAGWSPARLDRLRPRGDRACGGARRRAGRLRRRHVRLVHGDGLLDVGEVARPAALEHQPRGRSSCGSCRSSARSSAGPASASRLLNTVSDLCLKRLSPTAVISSTRYQSKATPIDMPKASRACMPEE